MRDFALKPDQPQTLTSGGVARANQLTGNARGEPGRAGAATFGIEWELAFQPAPEGAIAPASLGDDFSRISVHSDATRTVGAKVSVRKTLRDVFTARGPNFNPPMEQIAGPRAAVLSASGFSASRIMCKCDCGGECPEYLAETHGIGAMVWRKAKISVGPPDDRYEPEANRIESQAMGMPDPANLNPDGVMPAIQPRPEGDGLDSEPRLGTEPFEENRSGKKIKFEEIMDIAEKHILQPTATITTTAAPSAPEEKEPPRGIIVWEF